MCGYGGGGGGGMNIKTSYTVCRIELQVLIKSWILMYLKEMRKQQERKRDENLGYFLNMF